MRKPLPDDTREGGFALVIVLWLGVLLAIVAAVFANAVKSRLRETAVRASRLQAEALADAGARIGILALSNLDPNARFAPRYRSSDVVLTCSVANAGVLVIQFEDEEGKINLNTSNGAVLTALFIGLGASDSDARSYVAKILDFRDADDETRLDGAERNDYAKNNGTRQGPKNADFLTLSELDQVLGIPPNIRDRAKPYLTTYSQQNGADPARMPEGLAAILERGAHGAASLAGTSNGDNLPASFLAVSSRHVFTVRPEAFALAGARYSIEAIVQLPDTANSAPVIRQWEQSASTLKGPVDAITRGSWPPC